MYVLNKWVCFLDDQTIRHLLKECLATLQIRINVPHDYWTKNTLLKCINKNSYLEIIKD
jgi:hypothetical protein